MRKVALGLWLLLPLGVAAYHHGPGQDRLRLDEAEVRLALAREHAARGEWGQAARACDEALPLLAPEDLAGRRRVRLERARAGMQISELPRSHEDLTALLDELMADPGADPALVADTRLALASAQYYMTWLLRLEGLPREEWEGEAEGARQNYALLAEQAADPATRRARQEDLQAAIRLARMDPGDLAGLPIPEP